MESRPYEFLLQHDLVSGFTQKEREFWVSLPLLIRTLPIILRPHHLASYAREARDPQAAEIPNLSILAWRIPWMEESGRLQSMGLQRVGHSWMTKTTQTTADEWQVVDLFSYIPLLPFSHVSRRLLLIAMMTMGSTWKYLFPKPWAANCPKKQYILLMKKLFLSYVNETMCLFGGLFSFKT